MGTLDTLGNTAIDFAQNQPVAAAIVSIVLIVLVPLVVRFVRVVAMMIGFALLVLASYFYLGGTL